MVGRVKGLRRGLSAPSPFPFLPESRFSYGAPNPPHVIGEGLPSVPTVYDLVGRLPRTPVGVPRRGKGRFEPRRLRSPGVPVGYLQTVVRDFWLSGKGGVPSGVGTRVGVPPGKEGGRLTSPRSLRLVQQCVLSPDKGLSIVDRRHSPSPLLSVETKSLPLSPAPTPLFRE